jgi:zinc transport system permease protein
MNFFDFLNYGFIDRAYLAGSFIAVMCAMLGLFLVLRKLSLIGDGLSHVSFGAIALGLFFGVYPFYVAIPVVLLASCLILKLEKSARVYGDAAIGVVSAVGIAGGVILASLSRGFNVDLFSYLFGNILAISSSEVYLSVGLAVLVFLVIGLLYQELFSVTLEESYAKVTGIKTERISTVLALLTGVTVVLAVKVVGILLASSLLILPAVAALQISKGFKMAIVLSSIISVFSVLFGITFSFLADLPAGAMIIMTNFTIFVILFFWKKVSRA